MIKLYNTLTRKVEEFKPIEEGKVGMYTCGPTVYDYATIGNFRTYTMADLLLRTLKANGYEVKYVMNLTDVGHLTGDNLGDADTGEDRIEKAAKRESKTVWDIAQFYIDAFMVDFAKMNFQEPFKFCRATDHIEEQIELVKRIEEVGFAYKIDDGIYFDTVAFEGTTGKKYGELSNIDEAKAGARVEFNPQKKNARDFALWKFSPDPPAGGENRQMEWDSPWGKGFPGWHIECSAMSMKYLGKTFDIHTGGIDLMSTHHPNEIAQSEAATGKKFVNYWVHGNFILVDGKRMGKSEGNSYKISDIEEKGFSPLDLRYLYLTTHYRQLMNFTWESLEAAKTARAKLVEFTKNSDSRQTLSVEKNQSIEMYRQQFMDAMNNDLGTPAALALLWEVVKSNIPNADKKDLLLGFDDVLGLELRAESLGRRAEIPLAVRDLAQERDRLRSEGKWQEADKIRGEINQQGFGTIDTQNGTIVKKNN